MYYYNQKDKQMERKKLQRPSQEDFDKMTEEQQNLLLIQLQQEDTMSWQKHAAQIQVIVFWLAMGVGILWAVMKFNNSI